MDVTIQNIRGVIQNFGLSGSSLCIHSSLSSFGWVEGGASSVVEGLLEEGCTVLVPTFSWIFGISPPLDMQLKRNGWDYRAYAGPTSGIGRIYTPDSMEVDKDMGAIPAIALTKPQRVRGNHSLCSFTAIGPLADKLISGQKPLDVFAPLRILSEVNGSVILMGVDLNSMTILHLAERMAGRNLFQRWANCPDGRAMTVEVGGCGDGFNNFIPVFSQIMREVKVGQSRWLVFPAKDVLETATEAIKDNPWITHCDNPKCDRCNDAIIGGPILTEIFNS